MARDIHFWFLRHYGFRIRPKRVSHPLFAHSTPHILFITTCNDSRRHVFQFLALVIYVTHTHKLNTYGRANIATCFAVKFGYSFTRLNQFFRCDVSIDGRTFVIAINVVCRQDRNKCSHVNINRKNAIKRTSKKKHNYLATICLELLSMVGHVDIFML